ncbi:MAG: hypothetical protein EZS28_049827, partial [Streblomastix strix]
METQQQSKIDMDNKTSNIKQKEYTGGKLIEIDDENNRREFSQSSKELSTNDYCIADSDDKEDEEDDDDEDDDDDEEEDDEDEECFIKSALDQLRILFGTIDSVDTSYEQLPVIIIFIS